MSDAEVEVLDEELDHHLERGAQLVGAGDLEGALVPLGRAREIAPRDPKALALAGRTLYRLGRFEASAEAYATLVELSPAEVGARVNLGLAYLKAKRYPQAVRQLELALELGPGHRKAMNYLGLAWLEQGAPRKARAWFERAGSGHMVARCEQLLASGEAGAAAEDAEATDERDTGAEQDAARVLRARESGGGARRAGDRLGGLGGSQTFAMGRGLLSTQVRTEVLVREEGLLLARGAVKLAPEMKRFRGKATDKGFGEAPRRMLRATGTGELLHRVRGRLVRLALEEAAGYYREEALFAVEGSVAFENGRVASPTGSDLSLVHLRGPGVALFATGGELTRIEVTLSAPLRVVLPALVGFTGALTPKVVRLAGEGVGVPGEAVAVELGGEGHVLVDEGAASE